MNFFIALIVASLSVIGGSLVWPRLTPQPRPPVIQQIRDTVVKTSIGKQSASVLGVTDESHVQPVSVGEVVGGAIGMVERAVQQRIQTVVVKNAVNEISRQFDKLPKDEQEQIQQIICKPVSQ